MRFVSAALGSGCVRPRQHRRHGSEGQRFGNCSQLEEQRFPSKLGGSPAALLRRNELKSIEIVALTNKLMSHSSCFMY